MVELYFNRVALLSSVLIIEEPAFDFADDLLEDIGEDPDPSGRERTVPLFTDSVFDKPFLFLEFFWRARMKRRTPKEIMAAVAANSAVPCW